MVALVGSICSYSKHEGSVDVNANLLWKLISSVDSLPKNNAGRLFLHHCCGIQSQIVSWADPRAVDRWEGINFYTTLSLFHPAPEGRRRNRLLNHRCQPVVKKVTVWIRVIRYQTIQQTFRNAERSAAADWPPRRLSYDPLTPSSCLRKPLADESPLCSLTREESGGGKRSRALRPTLSHVSLIEAVRLRTVSSDSFVHFMNCFSSLTFFYLHVAGY